MSTEPNSSCRGRVWKSIKSISWQSRATESESSDVVGDVISVVVVWLTYCPTALHLSTTQGWSVFPIVGNLKILEYDEKSSHLLWMDLYHINLYHASLLVRKFSWNWPNIRKWGEWCKWYQIYTKFVFYRTSSSCWKIFFLKQVKHIPLLC